jgi:Spy/CpxP family protein refolding chaperone
VFQKELLMTKNRFASLVVVAAGFVLLCAAPGPARAQSTSPAAVQPKTMASAGAQPRKTSSPEDDFAGLNYTDEQKAEIEKIRQDTKLRKDTVEKDNKLTADQKDAMLVGYNRLEYGRIYMVLTPIQKSQVRQKVHARRAADQAAPKKTPHNQVDIK